MNNQAVAVEEKVLNTVETGAPMQETFQEVGKIVEEPSILNRKPLSFSTRPEWMALYNKHAKAYNCLAKKMEKSGIDLKILRNLTNADHALNRLSEQIIISYFTAVPLKQVIENYERADKEELERITRRFKQ